MTASKCTRIRMAQAAGALVLSLGVALGPQAVAQEVTVAEDQQGNITSVTVVLPNGQTVTLDADLATAIAAAVAEEDTENAFMAALEAAGIQEDADAVTAAAAYASSQASQAEGDTEQVQAKLQAIVDGAARSNPEAAGDAVRVASQAASQISGIPEEDYVTTLTAGMQNNPNVSDAARANANQAAQQAGLEVAEAGGGGAGDTLINPSSSVTENPSQDTSPIQ